MTATATRPPAQPADTSIAQRIKPRGDVRRTLLALLASALGAFPLCELFTDTGWLIDAWLTMIVVVAPALVLRRTRPPSAAQVWFGVALLIPWLTLTFLRQHAILGVLPFRGTWHDLGQAITSLHRTSTDGVAPVHTTVAVRLAVCALLGLIAALIDLLAVVGRHGALAGVPLLIVFTVSGAVPRHPVSWVWFVLAAIGFLILLALDSSDDVQRWGHFVPRSRSSRRRSRAISGQRIAVIAIALALAVPLFVPSSSKNLLVDLFHDGGGNGESGFGADHNGGLGTGGIDPFAALHGELNRDHPVPLLDVKITSPDGTVGIRGGVQPFYLRTNVLSNFEGDGWRPGPAGRSEPLDQTGFASEPGASFQPRVVHYSAQISVTGLRSNPPVFASPTAISGVSSTSAWSPRDLLLVGSTTDSRQVITEEVAQPDPTIQELRGAVASDADLASYLKLPSIRPYVRSLTDRITAQARTPYERARAISDFFGDPRNGFSYNLQTVTGDSGDELTDFLHKRIGYCQQYAASMAVMLRLAGVPSRVVLGYAHDVPDAQGEFTVTTFDAHAWVEAYFSGIGWVPFDPTPLAGISGGAQNDLAWAKHKQTNSNIEPVVPHQSNTAHPVTSTSAAAPQHASKSGDSGIALQAPLTVLGVLVFLVAVALTPAWVRWQRRRHRMHRIREGDTEALWAELADTTIDLGYVWSDARTPRQVARWLGSSADAASGSLQTLTSAVERARYAADGAPVGSAHDLASELDELRAGLGLRRSPRERMRARYWPASLNWSRLRWVGRWLPGTDTTTPRHR
jgi:transglutaminase-like putative cysteine protease